MATTTARAVLDTFYEEERKYMKAPPESRDFSGIAAILAPNFSMEQTSALPYAGLYRGPDGMEDWIRRMADCFDIVDVQTPEIFEKEGSDRIVILSTAHFRVRKTGEDLVYPMSQTVTVDLEKGVIVDFRSFYWDVQDINRALRYKP
ncbi:hypothetical protein QQZ08_007404 [Neonectria magnoliae]|uniref:SnoaL-like domain-containing protein n=1 Tax=Neonectria magnoliae TaxID=2732573 RepID=A0ABR1HZ66_9HYPO